MEGKEMEGIVKEIGKRRAYRAINPEKQIPVEVQDRILSAAILAPSCANKQPWRFLLIDGEEERGIVAQVLAGGNYWAKEAPLYVAVVTENDLDCDLEDRRHYALFDTGMAAMNLQLQAVKEELVVHPIAGFNDRELKKALSIPDSMVLITLIIIGYPGEKAKLSEKHQEQEHLPRQRKGMDEVVCRNRWCFHG
jgi:nitroreductase